jgi:ABC-type transport system substrate-binding protein
LRVEIGAAVASLDPDLTATTAEEAAAKLQIASLIYDQRDADGEFAGAAGSGAFRVTAFEVGKRVVLAANEDFSEGRPFVDSIEISMGRAAHERLVDLELSKTDLTEIAPQDARRAAEQGVRVSASQPDELLVLVSVAGNAGPEAGPNAGPNSAGAGSTRPAAQASGKSTGKPIGQVSVQARGAAEQAMGQALSLAIDRVAIVNFILQKTGETAGGLLPQWSSGTAFLFPAAAPSPADLEHAKELWKQIAPSGALVLGYDSADPLEQSVAERIAVNAKEAGMAVRALAMPGAGAGISRGAAGRATHVDVELVRWRMSSPLPGVALKDFLTRLYSEFLASFGAAAFPEITSPEDIYKQQRAVLSTFQVVPLVWLPQVYGLSARVRDWKAPGPGENWPLADVWLDTETPTPTPTGVQ